MKTDLYLGDCLEIMQELEDNSVDAVVTDPPYGKKYTRGKNGFGNAKTASFSRQDTTWDEKPPHKYFDEMMRVSNNQIIWGGNYFIDCLTPTNCMLVWDKKNGNNPYADVEIAWTSFNTVSKKFELFWLGSHIHRIEKIYHPTQKPTSLMIWCVKNYTSEGDTILDPFMGSGTTGVACVQTGRNFIGIEIEPKYFEIAKKRIAEAQLQIRMPI